MFGALKKIAALVQPKFPMPKVKGFPAQNFIAGLRNTVRDIKKYTPDYVELQQHKYQLLFCPDELMIGYHKNDLLGKSESLATAFTVDEYTMVKKRLGKQSQAITLKERNSMYPSLPIKGKLFAVRPYRFLEIDKYKENRVQFYRERVALSVPYSVKMWCKERDLLQRAFNEKRQHIFQQDPAIVEAWMYVGVNDYWKELLDGGMMYPAVKQYHHLNGGYYFFTKGEYSDK